MVVTATYKNKDSGETLKFQTTLNQDGTKFFLEVEGIKVPLNRRINPALLGLRLLTNGLDREQLIEFVNERCACLHPLEFEVFLDQRGFREDFKRAFENAPLVRVQEFSNQLNELLALKSETTFEFEEFDFDLDLPADLML